MITPILREQHTDAEPAEDGAEARMRQALGKLGTARQDKPKVARRATHQATPGAGRHRFRQDGEVPVVRHVLGAGGRGGERRAHAPAGNAAAGPGQENGEHHQGEVESARQVQGLTEQLRSTQTRLGHAELAVSEANRLAQDRQEEAAGLRQALDAANATLAQVRAELAASEQALEELEQRQVATRLFVPTLHDREDAPTCRKVGRPLGSTNRVGSQEPVSEPEPVRWWVGD